MAEFFDFLQTAIGTPTPKLFIVFGLLFLGVAVVGSITGRIQPGPIGRVLGGVLGPVLIVGGLVLDGGSMPLPVAQAAMPAVPVVAASPATSTATSTAVPTAFRFTSTPVVTTKGTPAPTATPPRRTPVPTATPLPLRSSLNTKAIDPKAVDLVNR